MQAKGVYTRSIKSISTPEDFSSAPTARGETTGLLLMLMTGVELLVPALAGETTLAKSVVGKTDVVDGATANHPINSLNQWTRNLQCFESKAREEAICLEK
jgi:hypothetical protein